ncbi:MAG: MBL fold metallo-hydrolase [Bacteroidetes bacterium]|nr:MAG: MBL fold metallo-hydrolase [Bacteroidota bacterium]
MRKILIFIFLLAPYFLLAQRDWSQIEITVTELSPGLHRLFVANAVAVVVSHGDDGVLVIDAAYEQSTDRLMEEIRKISDKPIKYLINTHLHADHTGGNKVIGKDADIIAHPSVKEFLSKEQRRGENIIPAFPDYAIPNILVDDNMDLEFNSEKIQITHLEGGHTEGDLIIYFPQANVLVMGDLLFAGYFPFVDVNNGGNPHSFLENVQRILDHFPNDVTLVGGHGPVFSHAELQTWHDELVKTFAVVAEAKSRGMSPEQMKNQRILQDWEEMGSFFITEDRWIETLYPFL